MMVVMLIPNSLLENGDGGGACYCFNVGFVGECVRGLKMLMPVWYCLVIPDFDKNDYNQLPL